MSVINQSKREINAKIVFFGPEQCGKGSLVRAVHQRIKPGLAGPLKEMPAGGATLQFFDYLPFERNSLDDYQVRFHLYTLTGKVENPAAWKMVLKGVDGVLLVTGAAEQQQQTVKAAQQLRSILAGYGVSLPQLPAVLVTAGDAGQAASAWGAEWDDRQVFVVPSGQSAAVVQPLASLSQEVVRCLRAACTPDVVEPAVVAEDVAAADGADACVGGTRAGVGLSSSFDGAMGTLEVPLSVALSGETISLPFQLKVGEQLRRFTLRLDVSITEEP